VWHWTCGAAEGSTTRAGSCRPRAGFLKSSVPAGSVRGQELGGRPGMVERRYIFPGVIEMNVQARRRLGVNIYLIDGGTEYALIDVGFLDELGDVLELIRQMNFSLSACKFIIATHADPHHPHRLAPAP